MRKKKQTLIIAEAGVNHNGDLDVAKSLIDAAAAAGVDLVKFQTFKADDLVSKVAKKAAYQKKNTGSEDDSQYQMLKQLELSHEDHIELIQYCHEKGIEFFSSAFDVKGLEYLNSLGFTRFKVPSGELTNYPYLKKLADIGKPVILSTGMANLKEIREALAVLKTGIKLEDITVLHCNTAYPTPMFDVNLRAMRTIQRECDVAIGFSDHTLGIEVPIAAVALGAKVIEKHFTLDKYMGGPDHLASLEPAELKAMVDAIRNVEQALSGNGKKEPTPSELKNMEVARKSIIAIGNIKQGDEFTNVNIAVKRPGNGINPMKWPVIINKKSKKNYKSDQLIDSNELD